MAVSRRTTWTRLEPRPRNKEVDEGLRAAVRDPLWLLSRQWQVSEFEGEDGGSPVRADVTVAEDALSRVDLRGGGRGGDGGPAGPFDYDGGPLEATVERERVMTDADPPTRRRAEAGQQFLRLLADAGYGEYAATDFAEQYRLSAPDEPLEAPDRRYVDLVEGRALDGTAVARAIQSAVGNLDAVLDDETSGWSGVTGAALPLPEGGSRTGTYEECAEDYYEWYVEVYDEPTAETGSAWDPTRLEYRFAVATGEADTETVFEAPEYQGGHLDWYSFSPASDGASLSPPADGATTESTTSVMPTRISFPGMPASRWWEIETDGVDLTEMAPDGAPLSRLFLTEFATVFGNDWFKIPLETPVGTLSRVTDCTVTDTFGVRETATSALADDRELFMQDLPGADEPGLFVPPTLATSVESDPVEKVVFARDEMANMAFATERRYEGPTGRSVDRTEFREPRLVVDDVHASESVDEEFLALENAGEDALDVSGYALRVVIDGDARTLHTFGDRELGPNATLRIHTGSASGGAAGAAPADVGSSGSGDGGSASDGDGGSASGDDTESTSGERADETATLGLGLSASVWTAAESLTVLDADGAVVRRHLLARPSDALADYRLSTDVADYWFPFTPVRDETFRLERALLLDADSLGKSIDEIARPRGEILDPPASRLPAGEDTYRLYDEEVTRSGRTVTRGYQFTRWIDGTGHLWSTRESGVGDTQLASGLAFDVLEERP